MPTARLAEITLAVDPPASDETNCCGSYRAGSFRAGPLYFAPVSWASLAASGPTVPTPVAYTRIVSPGTAGLAWVTGLPARLAQHRVLLRLVRITYRLALSPWSVLAPKVIPLPAGPAILARS